MLKSNPTPSVDFLHGIHETFHPVEDGTFHINHPCFVVENHIVRIYEIYALLDFEENSISNVIPFRLEDILIIDDFIMVVGLDMTTGEELGRNEYLIDNEGCAFKMMDFENLKNILNRTEIKQLLIKPDFLLYASRTLISLLLTP
jgi:hypothetical protein